MLRACNKTTFPYRNVLAYPGEDDRPHWDHASIYGSAGVLDERSRRLVAAAESKAIGRGGVSAVARATRHVTASHTSGHGRTE